MVIPSTFDTPRIFNDQTGWYVSMRNADEKFLHSTKYKQVGDEHLMGPFSNKAQAEEWLEGYISMHGENRNSDNFIPDSLNTHH
ncbi:MAG: hypothetical protein KAT06_12060 [Gammaproteobacteria bacterium]|nr:hypothetical protein [Gammaproteobacteria bacterium]